MYIKGDRGRYSHVDIRIGSFEKISRHRTLGRDKKKRIRRVQSIAMSSQGIYRKIRVEKGDIHVERWSDKNICRKGRFNSTR